MYLLIWKHLQKSLIASGLLTEKKFIKKGRLVYFSNRFIDIKQGKQLLSVACTFNNAH